MIPFEKPIPLKQNWVLFSYNIWNNKREGIKMELMFVLLMMGVFFYIAFIYLNVQYQIKGKQWVIRCAKETKSIPIDSIIEINETDYYEGTKETIVIGNTERTDYRFIILTKEKRYVLTGRMNNRLLTQLKEVNPAIRIFVKSLS